METSYEVGQRLKDAREDKRLLQKQVADLLATSQQQYSRYELGVQIIPAQHVITLAQFYNISADYLLGLIDQPRPLQGEASDG